MNLRRDPDRDYEQQVTELMLAVIAALRSYDATGNYWLRGFPNGSCQITSMVIGALLLELGYETYGRWFLVSRWSDRDSGYDVSHVWLELRDSDASGIYSIDASSDQFPKWETEPFVVYGRSPLADYFPSILFETPMCDIDLAAEGEVFTEPFAHVRHVLLGGEESM